MAMPLPPNLAALVAKGQLTPDAANSRMLANRPDWIAAHGGTGGAASGPLPSIHMPTPGPASAPGAAPGAPDIQSAIQGIRAQLGPQGPGGNQPDVMGRFSPTPVNPGTLGPGAVGPGAGISFQGGPNGPMPPDHMFPPNVPPLGIEVPTVPGGGSAGADSGSIGGASGHPPPTMPLPITGRATPPIFAGGQQGPAGRPSMPTPPLGRLNPAGMGRQKPQNRIGQLYQGLIKQRTPYAY